MKKEYQAKQAINVGVDWDKSLAAAKKSTKVLSRLCERLATSPMEWGSKQEG